jgi:Tol biopolymer transport system component
LSDKENYGGEYYLIDLDGSNYRRLAPDYFGVAEACYSPDSRYVAFISQKGTVREVYIMDADGNDTRQLTNSGNDCSSLKFSPDGEKLFFVQQWYDENEKPPLNEEIFSINVDGTDLRQLTQAKTEKAHNKQVLDVTNDHVFFLHVTFHEYNGIPIGQQSNDHEVWQMAHNGSRQKRIIGGGMTTGFYEETKVLPNGRSIVFVDSLRHSIPVLQIKDLNGPDKTLQLANTGACNSKIAVSPDSRYVAYMLLPRLLQNAETRGIGIVSVDGKESRSIGENWIKE